MIRFKTVLFSALFVLIPLVLFFALELGLFLRRPVGPPTPTVLTVPAGASFAEVSRRLEAAGVVKNVQAFRLLAWARGDARRIKAGEYEFGEPAVPARVLARLVAGDVRRLRLTVPEGLTLKEVAAKVEEAGLGRAETFLRLANDPAFIASLELKIPTLEGYLFPDTYYVSSGTPEERLIELMVRQFRHRLTPDLTDGAARLGLDPHQLVTLASIIQKEAGSLEEMPVIAAVFHNRLRQRMPLQADPTVIYGLQHFNGNLTKRDLLTPTPYNTYRIPGLPPGPIANPGAEALRAAAFPARADYLFFVARGDGRHEFTRTLREHNQAVQRYQLGR